MKKRILFLITGCLFTVGAMAQVGYGVRAGVNLGRSSYGEAPYKDYKVNNVSFHVTGYADIPVVSKLSIQPGVSLQGKGDKYKFNGDGLNGDADWDVMSVEIPVNAVYYIPTGEVGSVFLGAGPYVGFNISGKRKANGDIGSWIKTGEYDLKFTGDNKDMNLLDAGVNFLGGYKLNNGFLLHIGYGLGLSNLSPSDNPDRKLSNRTFSFGVGFQF